MEMFDLMTAECLFEKPSNDRPHYRCKSIVDIISGVVIRQTFVFVGKKHAYDLNLRENVVNKATLTEEASEVIKMPLLCLERS